VKDSVLQHKVAVEAKSLYNEYGLDRMIKMYSYVTWRGIAVFILPMIIAFVAIPLVTSWAMKVAIILIGSFISGIGA